MARRPNYTPRSVPEKYVKGVRRGDKSKRREEIAKRSKKSADDPKAYEEFETDIDPKTGKPYGTRESKHTRAYRQAYGQKAMGSVAKVAKATGIPKKIVQQVYDRGLAAWRTGHRPGATQHAWGLARVYSFATGGKTYSTADADLAKKAKEAGFVPKKKSNPPYHHLGGGCFVIPGREDPCDDQYEDVETGETYTMQHGFQEHFAAPQMLDRLPPYAQRMGNPKLKWTRKGSGPNTIWHTSIEGHEFAIVKTRIQYPGDPPHHETVYRFSIDGWTVNEGWRQEWGTTTVKDAKDAALEVFQAWQRGDFKAELKVKKGRASGKYSVFRDGKREAVSFTDRKAAHDYVKKQRKGYAPRQSNPSERSLIRLGFDGEGWFGVGSSQGIWLVVENGRAVGGIRTDFEDGGPVYAAGWDPHQALDISVSKGEWGNWVRLFPRRDQWETFDVPCGYGANCAISERETAAIKRRVLR